MSYNYKKVFFRRPLRTQMNLFFLWFLLFTVILIVPLTVLSIRYSNRLPKEGVVWKYNEHIIATFIPRSQNVDNAYISELRFGKYGEVIIPEGQTDVKEKNNINLSRNQINSPPIVEAKPPQVSPLKKYQQTQKVYEDNIKKFQVKSDEQVHISEPNFTDFGIVQGYRNFEETIAVGSESKKIIERCLERYFRIQPRFRGKIIVEFDVHPEGYVIDESLKILYSDIDYQPILDCILKSIRRWVSYPAVPFEQGIYSVTQKYIF